MAMRLLTTASFTKLHKVLVPKYQASFCSLKTVRFQSSSSSVEPVCLKAQEFSDNVALFDQNGQFTYGDLLGSSLTLAKEIVKLRGLKQTVASQDRIAFLCPNDAFYFIAQWATWLSGNIAIPLHKSHPKAQLEYYIQDAQVGLVLGTPDLATKVEDLAKKHSVSFIQLDADLLKNKTHLNAEEFVSRKFYEDSSALILYTSGTTGPPKGVVLTHKNLQAQIDTIVKSFELSREDCLLHTLPLHHTHGIIHAQLSPMSVGARINMLPQFNTHEVWKTLLSKSSGADRVNLLMAVPTMYIKLIEEYDKFREENNMSPEEILTRLKSDMSGSSALLQPVFERWEKITGHRIVERYGMTEIGLALTNPIHGFRKPSFVGLPLGTVEVALGLPDENSESGFQLIATSSASGTQVKPSFENEAGELFIKGPSVFKEYWNKPQATKDTFTSDGWFKTGDTVSFRENSFKIEGRTSVDIIKSGGYKISALDVERHLLAHPDIADCVIVGVADKVWGQRVTAVVVLRPKANEDNFTLDMLRAWCKAHMAPYTIPTRLKVVKELPKNAVGKVNKKELVKQLFPEDLK